MLSFGQVRPCTLTCHNVWSVASVVSWSGTCSYRLTSPTVCQLRAAGVGHVQVSVGAESAPGSDH